MSLAMRVIKPPASLVSFLICGGISHVKKDYNRTHLPLELRLKLCLFWVVENDRAVRPRF
jgi:hypothetical protein